MYKVEEKKVEKLYKRMRKKADWHECQLTLIGSNVIHKHTLVAQHRFCFIV